MGACWLQLLALLTEGVFYFGFMRSIQGGQSFEGWSGDINGDRTSTIRRVFAVFGVMVLLRGVLAFRRIVKHMMLKKSSGRRGSIVAVLGCLACLFVQLAFALQGVYMISLHDMEVRRGTCIHVCVYEYGWGITHLRTCMPGLQMLMEFGVMIGVMAFWDVLVYPWVRAAVVAAIIK
jgi:hypothetical protein